MALDTRAVVESLPQFVISVAAAARRPRRREELRVMSRLSGVRVGRPRGAARHDRQIAWGALTPRVGARTSSPTAGAGNQAVQRLLRRVPARDVSAPRRDDVRKREAAGHLGIGHSLDPHTRRDLQRRLGADLGSIRIHMSDAAARSARSLGAIAYTSGRDILFAKGQFAPETAAGRRLLIHELVHAVRHAGGAPAIYRKCGPAGYPPAPESFVFADSIPKGVRYYYEVRCDHPLRNEKDLMQRLAKSLPSTSRVRITGMASSEGDRDFNRSLACHRALDAVSVFSDAGITVVSIKAIVPPGTDNNDSVRSVIVEVDGLDAPIDPPKPKPQPAPRPDNPKGPVCGPDMEAPIDQTLSDIRSTFKGFSASQKEDNCAQLASFNLFKKGGFVNAWDIADLLANGGGSSWLDRGRFHPPCCEPLDPSDVESSKTCGRTIEVGGKCFLAGTVNYVQFGQISRLCHDEFPAGLSRLGGIVLITFNRTVTINRVLAFKSISFDDPGPPIEWAIAGFDGFPANKGSTSNRSLCQTICPVRHPTMALRWIWEPNRPR